MSVNNLWACEFIFARKRRLITHPNPLLKREELVKNMDYVEKVLKNGAEKARDIADKKVREVRKVVGLMGRNY